MSLDNAPQDLQCVSLLEVLEETNLSVLDQLHAKGVQTVEGLMALSEEAIDELGVKKLQAKKLKLLIKDGSKSLKWLVKELYEANQSPADVKSLSLPPYVRDTPVSDAGWILMKFKTEAPHNDELRRVHFSYDRFHSGFMKQFYCGVRQQIPGTDGQCGPSNGPSCPSCARFLASALGQELLPLTTWDRGRTRLNIGNAFKYPGYDGSLKIYCGGPCRSADTNGECGRAAGGQCESCERFTEEAWAAVEGYH